MSIPNALAYQASFLTQNQPVVVEGSVAQIADGGDSVRLYYTIRKVVSYILIFMFIVLLLSTSGAVSQTVVGLALGLGSAMLIGVAGYGLLNATKIAAKLATLGTKSVIESVVNTNIMQ